MTDADLRGYLNAVTDIALAAGRRILEIYNSEFTVSDKEDGSPVTAADQAAQDVIVRGLTQLAPNIPVLAEESADVGYEQRRSWSRFWLVDPLDGTKEFIKRNGEFTVNIALIENNAPVLGVVHVPVKEITYSACRGSGAFKRHDGADWITLQARHYDGRRPPCVVASRSHADKSQHDYLERLGNHELVSMGSSLKFCLVAEGVADVYPRLGPTMEWDTAAAQCVVEQAGGRVVASDGQPLRYNKPSLKNPWIVTSGTGDYDWLRFLPPS